MAGSSRIHPVYAQMEQTVFDRMSQLARQHDAINLGQGFPSDAEPEAVIEAAVRALREQSNQYPPGRGLANLRSAIAAFYADLQAPGFAEGEFDIVVTSGATEAIACAVLALVAPGDEVILFQPAYDAYAPLVRRAGGVPVPVDLRPPFFRYEREAVEAAITRQTRAMIVNDPLNPAGTLASEAELAMLAQVCTRHDLVAIADEVWEGVRFDGAAHRSLMTFDGMAGRTVKIGSAGKLLGVTGWKVGWMIAAPDVCEGLANAHQFLTYATAAPLQHAVAESLQQIDDVLPAQHASWAASRRRLADGLAEAGFAVLTNSATWFLCIDIAASGIALDDRTFCERAVVEAGVAMVPVSAFYEGAGTPRHIVRLCFTKPADMLDEAVRRLALWRGNLARTST